MKTIFLFLSLFTLASCVNNPYSTYYNDEGIDRSEILTNEPVKVIETLNAEAKLKEFYKNGYVLLGTSSFNSEWVPFSEAIDTAKEKGASVVILDTDVTGSVRKSFVMVLPQTHTTYHSGTVNTYGTYGNTYSNYHGTSTSTSYNYSTHNYEVTTFQQQAYFLAKKITQHKDD